MSTYERTREFHTAFGHPVRETPQAVPTRDEAILMIGLIEEELHELVRALFPTMAIGGDEGYGNLDSYYTIADELRVFVNTYPYAPDMTEAADAVADLDVVVNGAGLRMGLPMEALSSEVFMSNMSKLGADGKPIYREDGKILKGPNYFKPEIDAVLDRALNEHLAKDPEVAA